MCLAAIAWLAHPRYRLVLIANRDEFHARPTLPVTTWPDRDGVLAGRDLQAGGTWLGLHRSGRFGLITNFRDQRSPQAAPTRGQLIPDFLDGPQSPDDYLRELSQQADRYAGFNLVLGDQQGLWYASNRHPNFMTPLAAGVYALSNHLLDTPWPKLTRLRQALERWLGIQNTFAHDRSRDPATDATELWHALSDRTPAEPENLPQTGVSLEWEQLLSAPFIVHPNYGTRCSTVMLIEHNHSVHLEERSYANDGRQTQRQCWKTVIDQWPPEPYEGARLQ